MSTIFLAIWLCTFGSANSKISDLQIKSFIDAGISQLNDTNFDSELDLKFFDSFSNNLTKGNSSENKQLMQLFAENGGAEILKNWFHRFENYKSSGDGNIRLLKSFSSRAIWLVWYGAVYKQFSNEKYLVKKLTSFIFTPLLFFDSDFTIDMLTLGLSAINEVQQNNFRFGLQPILRNLFGSELTTIEKRFKSEDSPILKLLLASILVHKFPEKISYDQSELFHIDLSLLLLIRDFLILGPENPESLFVVPLKTKFVAMTGHRLEIIRLFNLALLAPSNRGELCDKPTFDFFFNSIAKCVSSRIESFFRQRSCLYALRGIFMLCQTCANAQHFFSKSSRKGKAASELNSTQLDHPEYLSAILDVEAIAKHAKYEEYNEIKEEAVLIWLFLEKPGIFCSSDRWILKNDNYGIKGRCEQNTWKCAPFVSFLSVS